MSRIIYYANSLLTAEQLSQSEVFVMTDMGYIIQAALGSSDMGATGLACVPTSAPSLSVQVGDGALYAKNTLDVSNFGPMGTNSNTIVKMAVHTGPTVFNFPNTLTSGESINYLIEAAFLETDDTPEVVQYYNKNDPTSNFYGVNNSGASQYTIRRTKVSFNVLPGASDTTGTQIAPTPSDGFIPLWVVTVNYGQSHIDVSSIQKADGSNFAEDRLVPYAKLDSPVFTGNPQAPTPAVNDASNSVATTNFVYENVQLIDQTITNSVDQLASDVANTYATLVDLQAYAPINNAALTGIPTAPTPISNSNSNQIATTGWVAQNVATVPPGAVFFFPNSFLPNGYLECNGAEVSRTDYPNLYQAIGTRFGSGDGIHTFNLPDLRGQFIRAWDSSGLVDPNRLLGSKQTDAMQGHFHEPLKPHTTTFHGDAGDVNTHARPSGVGTDAIAPSTGGPITDGTNGTPRIANETRPVNVALVACIKT